jgi:hypothetical protein
VFDFLDDYVRRQGITGEVKVWITGYSRAAATANLVAGAIDDGRKISNLTVMPENLYVYTFETPAGAMDSAVRNESDEDDGLYTNIFNHMNPHDPVTKVGPAIWNFARYGVDRYFPFRIESNYFTELLPAMLAQYSQLRSVDGYIVDDFRRWRTKLLDDIFDIEAADDETHGFQNYFLDNVVDTFISEVFKSRANYVNKFQVDMREVLYLAMGLDVADSARFEDCLGAELWADLPALLYYAATANSNPAAKILLSDRLLKCVENSLAQAGITNYDRYDALRIAGLLAEAVFTLAVNYPGDVATLVVNLKGLIAAHYPDLCLAWLQAMDSNYTDRVIVYNEIFGFRIVSVNCPVDVNVYDENDRLVAVIAADKVVDLDSEVWATINQDGEKLFYLPAHKSYRLEISATAAGNMSYAVQEFDLGGGAPRRLVAYYDLPLIAGGHYTAFAPAHNTDDPNGSAADYILLDGRNPVAAAAELRGAKAAEAYYTVDIWTAEPERGLIMGGGSRQLGRYAQVAAASAPGCVFAGWYEGEEMVSAMAEYRFAARRNVTLEARFVPDPQDPSDSDPQNPNPQDPDNPDPQSPDDDPNPQGPGNSDPQDPDPQNPGDSDSQDPENSDPQNPNPPNPQDPDSSGPQDPSDPDRQDDPQTPDPQTPKPASPTRSGTFSNSSAAGGTLAYIGGANRVLTSVAISHYGWTTADTVIIASGADANLVDALAAAPLAGQEDAPILLCMGDELDSAVRVELLRLRLKKIYTVGAVSQIVVDELAETPEWSVETLRGHDRFETAELISAKVENPQGVFVVGYDAVADAVSAAPYAAAHGYLIQIAGPDGLLGTDPLTTDHRCILGGPALVRDVPGATRIYGPDRYATNQALRETLPFSSDTLYIADGLTLVDALTGSALAARSGAAVMLVPSAPRTAPTDGVDPLMKVYAFGAEAGS